MSTLISGLLNIGSSLIERLFPDPEEQAKAKQQLQQMEKDGELKELSLRLSAINAEASSEDKWTSRARPTFMYVFYIVILVLVVVSPILGIFFPEQITLFYQKVDEGFKAIPEALWVTFTTGYLGYSYMRYREKKVRILTGKVHN